jgi:hypothetical protein
MHTMEDHKDRHGAPPPPGVVTKDDIEFNAENPNIARADPPTADETAGVTSQAKGTYPNIIEGSDSQRTGTSWGLRPRADGEVVATPEGPMPEGEGEGQAHPTRNTGDRLAHDELDDVGAWKTMDTLS